MIPSFFRRMESSTSCSWTSSSSSISTTRLDLTSVSSGEEALALAREQSRYNLIISSMHLGDMSVLDLARKLREEGLNVPSILLGYDNRDLTDFVNKHDVSDIDKIFLWQGDVRILLAIVKYIEDKMNVSHDTGMVGVQTIIVIEDNIRFYSSFLPMIYTELMKHCTRLATRRDQSRPQDHADPGSAQDSAL